MSGSRAIARPLRLERPVWSLPALARFAAWGALFAGVLSLVGFALQRTGIPPGDAAGLEAVAAVRSGWDVTLARALTFLADLWVVSAITAVVGVVVYLRVRRWDLVWLVAAAVGGALAVTGTVKLITDRPRPDGALAGAVSSSFPSGHSVRGMVVYGLIAWLLFRLGRGVARPLGITVALVLAFATGLSRVWLAVHWPSDVLFGYALGALWLLVTLSVTRPRRVGVVPEASRPPAGDEAETHGPTF
ncbi:phosphatase PAP2 family protein [Egicoccus sp. AB-alg6-2]|uniref:phosphatase PAP2 family protein n=1 Tax=Egicoccus sp. AB-alg6-2 TaxID=3242692 RepID=UPI00359DD461